MRDTPQTPAPPAAPIESTAARTSLVHPMSWALLGALAVAYLTLSITSLLGKSVTVDEFGHLPAGFNTLRSGDFRHCTLNPPLMNVLSALPVAAMGPRPTQEPPPFRLAPSFDFWESGYRFMFAYPEDYRRLFTAARCVTVVLVGGLGVLLFFWARSLAPRRADLAGLLAAGLLWFSPNVLAHARLVTTDAGAMCFVTLAVFAFHRLLLRPNGPRAIGCGVALGLAQLVKFTAIYLAPLFMVVAVVWCFGGPKIRGTALAKWLAAALAVGLGTVNAGYLFAGSGEALGAYTFESDTLKAVRAALPRQTPVPLPHEYVAAFDRQLRDATVGDSSYLLGESYEGGRWYYFLVLIAFKTPIPLLALAALALTTGLTGRGLHRRESVLLLLPGLVFLVMFSLFSDKQLGLRMILPAAPLLFVWIATTIARAEWKRWTVWPLAGLLLWFAGESLGSYPDYLAYFNQFVGGPARGHRIALDSNLDWGQDLPKLKDYMDAEGIDSIQLLYFGRVDPAIYGIRYQADPRRFGPGYRAVSATLFGRWYRLYDHGVVREVDAVDPRTLGEPVARLGHSIHVYWVE